MSYGQFFALSVIRLGQKLGAGGGGEGGDVYPGGGGGVNKNW